ncbi:hypothetical protein SOVF_140340 [Spinacia oleracea]|nr:hypothetical protein SOVF_140340 [Spinacia oleracea]
MSSILGRCFSLLAIYLAMTQVCLGSPNSVEKVQLDFYYESLCPYCADFITKELPIIFDNGLIDIVNLRLIPWGNARISTSNSFDCQHGSTECLFNSVEACAIAAWPNPKDHFPFITCVENQVSKGEYNQWETCFKKLGLDPNPVTSCYKSQSGKKLQKNYAALTDALQPHHEYVPWVVVAGEPLRQDNNNFISYICKAYEGDPPSACQEASLASIFKEKIAHVFCPVSRG